MSAASTQAAIICAGPAGLLLGQLLRGRGRISFGHAWNGNPDETLSFNCLENQT